MSATANCPICPERIQVPTINAWRDTKDIERQQALDELDKHTQLKHNIKLVEAY